MEEHPNHLPKCERCMIKVLVGILNNRHYASDKFKQGEERHLRRETLQRCFEASRVLFQINTETLPPSEGFPYLVLMIAYNNSDWEAVYQNLGKARRRRVMLVRGLERTGATVRFQVVIYKAVAQSVLLYDTQIWVVTGDVLKVLEGFHHQAARRITGMTKNAGQAESGSTPR